MEMIKTVLYKRHLALGAKMVEFGGFLMPMNYHGGIVEEHLTTRKAAGLFDVSHMGRFRFAGNKALKFLQHVLTNDADELGPGQAQYTMLANENGGAIDDAYLFRYSTDEFLLIVNASNRKKDWQHLSTALNDFADVDMQDVSEEIAMLALQGPRSESILNSIIDSGPLPDSKHNLHSIVTIHGSEIRVSRTGYTGEPVCFELLMARDNAPVIWDMLIEKGATPTGLGARDTLRLEAGLPLYGHELGLGPDGREIPILALPISKFAVSFSTGKADFIGRKALEKQFEAREKIKRGDYSSSDQLVRIQRKIELLGKGIAREGCRVYSDEKDIGHVTSGTMVPYWKLDDEMQMTNERGMRAICLAMLDNTFVVGDKVEVEIRGKKIESLIVPKFKIPVITDQ
jgi:glycine cleavage system T protein (aminomethyltransferase)